MASALVTKQTIDSSGIKDEFDVSQIPQGQLWVQSVSSSFVGSVDLEVSLDGATFVSALTLTAGDIEVVPLLAVKARFNCTSYTSGSLAVTAAGHNPQ